MSSTVIISDVLPWTQSIASSSQTQFDTNWTADVAADVEVYARADGVAPNDITQLVSPNDYIISFVGAEQYVRVTFLVGRTMDDIITITRLTPVDRENLYINTNFTPSMLNGDFGRQTMMTQERELLNTGFTPRYNISATLVEPKDLIFPLLEANESWRKNSANTAFEAFVALGGDAIAGVKFIVQQPNSLVPAAQALSALSTGIVKSTTTSGVLSISAPISSLDSIGIDTDKLPYGAGTNVYSLTDLTAYSRSLLAEPTAADWRATLGVGPSGAFFAIANNLSEGVPSTMRSNLGLVIGTDVQAYSPTLQSISPLGTTSDRTIYTTGLNTWAETTLTSFGRSLIASANASAAATTLQVLPLSGGTLTGDLFLNGPATTGSMPTTLAQVEAMFQNEQIACVCMTDADMPTWTYNNGSSGVGATLTAPSNGASTFDGISPTDGQRVFVNLQTSNLAWQGPYTVVQGTVSTPTVLTRTTDWNQASDMQAGDIFSVVSGTTWAASQWMMSQTGAITVGTTALTFSQMVGQGALLRANNLSDLTNVATARSNLGLVIGTNVQAYDATLQSISALGTAANKMIYTTGIDTWAETDASAFGRSLINLTSQNNALLVTNNSGVASMLAGPGVNNSLLKSNATAAPSYDTLTSIMDAVLGSTQGSIIYRNATQWVVLAPGTNGYFLETKGSAQNPQWSLVDEAGSSLSMSLILMGG